MNNAWWASEGWALQNAPPAAAEADAPLHERLLAMHRACNAVDSATMDASGWAGWLRLPEDRFVAAVTLRGRAALTALVSPAASNVASVAVTESEWSRAALAVGLAEVVHDTTLGQDMDTNATAAQLRIAMMFGRTFKGVGKQAIAVDVLPCVSNDPVELLTQLVLPTPELRSMCVSCLEDMATRDATAPSRLQCIAEHFAPMHAALLFRRMPLPEDVALFACVQELHSAMGNKSC